MKKLREDMQIIFQDPFASINPRMTVSQTIAEPLLIQGKYKPGDKEALNRHVRQVMDRVGLAQRLVNAYPHELDGGRRQRIGIGRALALEPKFIVCDEPVSALDVSIQAQILNLMQDIQEEMGLTYLFITHDLSVVKHLSNQIMVMYLGQVVEICDAKQLFPYAGASLHKGAAVRHSDPGSAGQNEQRSRSRASFRPQSTPSPAVGLQSVAHMPHRSALRATSRCARLSPVTA